MNRYSPFPPEQHPITQMADFLYGGGNARIFIRLRMVHLLTYMCPY